MSDALAKEATVANTPKTCRCYKSEERDPKCEEEFPLICPWWQEQLRRHVTGDFTGPSPCPYPSAKDG